MKAHRVYDSVVFACPGCGAPHAVRVDDTLHPGHTHWSYNGDADAPTIVPSILKQSHTWEPQVTPANVHAWQAAPWEQTRVQAVCHSIIIAGRIQFLDDCTHFLAGQLVDLPDWKKP